MKTLTKALTWGPEEPTLTTVPTNTTAFALQQKVQYKLMSDEKRFFVNTDVANLLYKTLTMVMINMKECYIEKYTPLHLWKCHHQYETTIILTTNVTWSNVAPTATSITRFWPDQSHGRKCLKRHTRLSMSLALFLDSLYWKGVSKHNLPTYFISQRWPQKYSGCCGQKWSWIFVLLHKSTNLWIKNI